MDFSKFLPIRASRLGVKHFDEVFSYFSNPAILLSVAGEILRCNDAALELYNISSAQVLKQDYFEVCRQHNITSPFTSLKEMLDQPSKISVTIVNGHLHPAKTIQWIVAAVKHNNHLESFYLQGFDITSVANSSTIAKQIQNSIIDHLPNHFIFWKDRNSVFLGCNRAFALSANLNSSADIIGKTDYDLPWSKEDSDSYIADDRQVMESKQAKLNIEEPQTFPDGKKIILLTSKVPLYDEQGEVYGVLAIYFDITQQKMNELQLIETNQKLEKLSKVKSEFVRNISHDIRTPLAGIQQTVRAMADGQIPEEELPEHALAAWEASNKLMELFDQIIDVSKKEHFDFEDRIAKFDLYKLLLGLGKTYEVVAKHKGLRLEIEYSEQVPHYLLGKHLRLHRILMNLLGNALKFTEKGSVKLLVEKSQETNEKEVVLRFSVIDTGIGISEEKHAAIFEPFSRLNPSFQAQYPGSGLGLHVVKDYIKKMDGEIYVESEEGEGSMFTCVLPFVRPILDNDNDVVETEYIQVVAAEITQPKERFNKNKSAPIENNSTVKYRVLLVEDDKVAQNMGTLLLRSNGYQVDLAKSGDDALELTSKNPYDLIYMDIGLGTGIDGIETTQRIRANKQNPNQHTFITALTAHGDEIIAKQCLDAGMQHVLSKPLSNEKIQQIHTILAKPGETNEKQTVIDFELWISRLAGQEHMLEEIFHMLAKEFEITRLAMIKAYETHDLPTLKAVTHKMKGALGYCGLPRLETAMRAIEGAAKEGDEQEVNKWYQETLDALDEAAQIYKEWAVEHPIKPA